MAFIGPTDSLLSDAQKTLELMAENSHEGIAIIGSDYKVECINDRICELLGRPREEILGQSFLAFVESDSSELVLERYAKRVRGVPIDNEYEIRTLCAHGGARHVRVRTSVLRDNGEGLKILAQVLDLTEQRQTQQALNEREATFHTLVNTMNEGLGVIDDNGTIVYANVALCRMLGSSEEQIIGKTAGDIMHGPDLDAVFQKIRNRIAGKCERYEARLVRESGALVPVIVSASPVQSESGEYVGSCAVFTDITEENMAKKRLETARDRAVLYLDLMRHDIRNHLQEVQFAAELIEIKSNDATVRQMAGDIHEAVRRSTKVIADSRTIEQLEEVPLEERILDEVLHEMMQDASILLDNVEISLSLHATNVRIMANEYLEVMLSDLLTFAYHRSRDEVRRIWVDLREADDSYELSVTDDGPRLPLAMTDHPLHHGLRLAGVSLHLALHVARTYGGELELKGRNKGGKNRGTTIRVTLPRIVTDSPRRAKHDAAQ
jgi:PAS domain S-box-containing protein